MRNSNSNITSDDESSVTISDDDAVTTETDTDVGSKYDAVESIPFRQGEKVLAYHKRLIYEAKVLLS